MFIPVNKGLTRKIDTNNTNKKQKHGNKEIHFLVKPLLRIGQG